VLRGSLAKVFPDEVRSGNSTVFFKDKEYKAEFKKNSNEDGILLDFLFHSALVQCCFSWLPTTTNPIWR